MPPEAVDELARAVLQARALQFRHMVIETAGLFWIAVEMMILYAVLVARRFLGQHPLPTGLALTRYERRRAWVWSLSFAGIATLLYARHTVLAPLSQVLEESGPHAVLSTVKAAYIRRVYEHLAVWSVFITLWVAFEMLIVYHGWRAFRLLRSRLQGQFADAA